MEQLYYDIILLLCPCSFVRKFRRDILNFLLIGFSFFLDYSALWLSFPVCYGGGEETQKDLSGYILDGFFIAMKP